eukprot:UN07524
MITILVILYLFLYISVNQSKLVSRVVGSRLSGC